MSARWREIVADGEDGVLVPADLPEEAIIARFTETIRRLAADRAALRAMGAAAASRAAALDWETCMQDFLARLDALVPGTAAVPVIEDAAMHAPAWVAP